MRNALGLMLGCFLAAAMIGGGWLFATSLRASQAALQTVAAKEPPPLPPSSAKLAAKDDVEFTAALDAKPATSPAPLPLPMPQKSTCANPDALGLSRVVEIDTTGGPG